MSTQTRNALGDRVRHVITLDSGESTAINLDSMADADYLSITVSVPAGGSATAHGSLDDAAVVANPAEDAFPLFGNDGVVSATTTRATTCVPFPGPLRSVFVSAGSGNIGAVRVVVLQ